MSLLVYNKSGADVVLAGTGITIPASTLPPLPGAPVNVSSELEGLTNGQFAAIEVQRLATPLEFVWIGLPLFETTGLTTTDVYGNPNVVLTSNDGSVTIADKDLTVSFGTAITEVAAATSAGVLAEAARVDHVHKMGTAAMAAVYTAIYGAINSTGIDGSFDLDGTNTVPWATKVGSVYTVTRVAYCNNGRIRSGVTLKTANYHGPYGRGKLTVDSGGIITNSGNSGSGATGGAAVAAGTFFANAAGGTGQTTAGGSGGVSAVAMPPTSLHFSGGVGGAGTGAGGSQGTVTPAAATRGGAHGGIQLLGAIAHSQQSAAVFSFGTGGGGGGGDLVSVAGGGGGAGGGGLSLGWGEIENNGSISAMGGDGAAGTGSNAGGGGGGGGGYVGITCGKYSGSGVILVTGGNGGAGGGGTGLPGNAGVEGLIDLQYPEAA